MRSFNRFLDSCLLAILVAPFAQAQPEPDGSLVYDNRGRSRHLDPADSAFVAARMSEYVKRCTDTSYLHSDRPSMYSRKLRFSIEEGTFELLMQSNGLNQDEMVLYRIDGDGVRHFRSCGSRGVLPVLALMADISIPDGRDIADLRSGAASGQEAGTEDDRGFLTRIGRLSSHEPNLLLLRSDDNDDNAYMDFTVSVKHPFLGPVQVPRSKYSSQTYFAFSGRFSQYLGTRDSSPVVARRFNPQLYVRVHEFWDSFINIGFAHESNGQQIEDLMTFEQAERNYESRNQDPVFARDELSRGWDYVSLDWETLWNPRIGTLTTQLNLKHFLEHGPLQDEAEDYNAWEYPGETLKFRRQYDGANLGVRYDFPEGTCVFNLLCARKVAWNYTTGIGSPGKHNTNSFEFTTSIANVPLIVWARTGYNSDLVDYYRYVSSWGLGVELVSY